MFKNEVALPPHYCMGVGFVHVWGLVKLTYLNWSAGESCRTWSHMCRSWYFPKFLLREGSFTQIYIASFMFLVIPCDSVSTMVKHSGLTQCPVELLWWWIGNEALRCSLSLSPMVLLESPLYFCGQLMCGHLNLYMTPLFWRLLSLSLEPWGGFLWCWYPWNVPGSPNCCMSFWTFPQSTDVRYHYGDVLVAVVVCYTVVVRLVVSRSLFIVDVVFVVKFVL